MARAAHLPYYRPLSEAVWRASVWDAGTELSPWPGDAADAGSWRTWLAGVWTVRAVREAVSLASPALADQVGHVLASSPSTAAQLHRTGISVARYLIRAKGRATPFGVFAGVGPARFSDRTALDWGERHRLRTRADAAWLADVVARAEGLLALRERLPVVVNSLAVERGDRLVVPWQPHLGAAVRSVGGEVEEVSVRLLPVVAAICQVAGTPVAAGVLVDRVAAELPGVDREALLHAVGQLVASGVLITSLRAPGTCTDPLGHLLRELEAAGADALPDAEALYAELGAVHAGLVDLDRPGSRVEERRHVVAGRMRALSAVVDSPVCVDLRLAGTLVLPRQVADEAAAAADALMRLTPRRSASASWREYHRDFLARYGPGTPVPVVELTDPARGIGFPLHFTHRPAGREVTPRDEALLALAHQAAWSRATEVVLDDRAIVGLSLGAAGEPPVTAVDLCAVVLSESDAAVDRGEFTLAVTGFGRTGATTGRFFDLLDDGRHPALALAGSPPVGVNGALAAQLSFPPRRIRSENVLRVPRVLPHVIPIAEHRRTDGQHIAVADLAVVADGARLHVVSLSRNRVVEPVLPHAGARHTMPPLARLLFEIPRSTHPAIIVFDWGAAVCLPYLPRLRYGRSVLAPARWRVDPAHLPGPEAPAGRWAAAWEKVRQELRMPATVSVGEGDRRLRLELGQDMDLAVLRSHLRAADGPVTVTEAPTGAELGWCGGRAHEIVFPLTPTAPPRAAPRFLPAVTPMRITGRSDSPGDGGGVVFAKLYGPGEAIDTVLTRHLPNLLSRWQTPPRWWFVRYRHPRPHLRLRIHDTDRQRAAGHLAVWSEELRRAGLAGEITFDTYRPESGRYGTGAAMDAAEALFATDSAAVLAQLAVLANQADVPPQALTAASLVDLSAAVTGSRMAGLRWLLDHPELAAGALPQDRQARRHILRLAEPGALHDLAGGAELAAAWAARARAAAHYCQTLTALDPARPGGASVLGSLLHLHQVRAHGDPVSEATTYKLARSVALADTANRPDRQHGQGR
ncbi:lantibiotic dehydratase [Kitasatospora sp. NPDC059795]|uniref:lantibiotic dehydratase n=1 Tax=Kitasatospora sp. NPDC059795 TaxID=3346949 RepID=UPI0036557980